MCCIHFFCSDFDCFIRYDYYYCTSKIIYLKWKSGSFRIPRVDATAELKVILLHCTANVYCTMNLKCFGCDFDADIQRHFLCATSNECVVLCYIAASIFLFFFLADDSSFIAQTLTGWTGGSCLVHYCDKLVKPSAAEMIAVWLLLSHDAR